MEKTSRKRKTISDIILIGFILLIALIGCAFLLLRGEGDVVEVTVDGKLYGTYSLSVDVAEDIITGNDASQHNRLVIKNGKAYVESASCPDGICSSHRPIYRDGESIVCLPNKVVITVKASSSGSAPDVVA